jgi:hypothetical protein
MTLPSLASRGSAVVWSRGWVRSASWLHLRPPLVQQVGLAQPGAWPITAPGGSFFHARWQLCTAASPLRGPASHSRAHSSEGVGENAGAPPVDKIRASERKRPRRQRASGRQRGKKPDTSASSGGRQQ